MWTRMEDRVLDVFLYALVIFGGAWELSSESRERSRARED